MGYTVGEYKRRILQFLCALSVTTFGLISPHFSGPG